MVGHYLAVAVHKFLGLKITVQQSHPVFVT